MDELNQAVPSKLRIIEVELSQDDNKQEISHLSEVNKDVLNSYLVKPVKLDTMIDAYLKRMDKYLEREISKEFMMES
jgi:hypothetical protein